MCFVNDGATRYVAVKVAEQFGKEISEMLNEFSNVVIMGPCPASIVRDDQEGTYAQCVEAFMKALVGSHIQYVEAVKWHKRVTHGCRFAADGNKIHRLLPILGEKSNAEVYGICSAIQDQMIQVLYLLAYSQSLPAWVEQQLISFTRAHFVREAGDDEQ